MTDRSDDPAPRRDRSRRLFTAGLLALGLLILFAVGVFSHGYRLYTAEGAFDTDRIVFIDKGSSLNTIAGTLHDTGVIDRPFLYSLAVRIEGSARLLQAGEYRIPAQASMAEVTDILVSGETVLHPLTVAEGLSVKQVVALVNATALLTGKVETLPPEGTLLPETYLYSRGDKASALIGRMQQSMDSTLAELWAQRDEGLPLNTRDEALILASIVEKETAVAEERPRIAAVFLNRLRRGMKLQSDPTVVYALTGGLPLGRRLTYDDLEIDSPYNTYRYTGLPPTPIANPGRAAIEAVVRPLQSDELYFVADGSGGHAFASTLAEHERNVKRWRRVRAK